MLIAQEHGVTAPKEPAEDNTETQSPDNKHHDTFSAESASVEHNATCELVREYSQVVLTDDDDFVFDDSNPQKVLEMQLVENNVHIYLTTR